MATQPDDDDTPNGPRPNKKGLRDHPLLLIGAIAFVLIAVGGLIWWLNARNFESTDDAFIDTHIVRLAPQIAGRVTQVLVNDNQLVRPGQPVAMIDSADVETSVDQARAQQAQAQAQVDNAQAQIEVSQACIPSGAAPTWRPRGPRPTTRRTDLARYHRLQATQPPGGGPAAAGSGRHARPARPRPSATRRRRPSKPAPTRSRPAAPRSPPRRGPGPAPPRPSSTKRASTSATPASSRRWPAMSPRGPWPWATMCSRARS